MQKTNREVLEFLGGARVWLEQNKEETKLRWAVTRVVKRAEDIQRDVQEAIDDINVEHAMTLQEGPEKGKLIQGDRGTYQYTKEGMMNRTRALRALMVKPVTIEPYIAKEVPEKLTTAERDLFVDFVLPPEHRLEVVA